MLRRDTSIARTVDVESGRNSETGMSVIVRRPAAVNPAWLLPTRVRPGECSQSGRENGGERLNTETVGCYYSSHRVCCERAGAPVSNCSSTHQARLSRPQ